MCDETTNVGTTPTERLLFQLCRESFLKFWSYANVFRDQGKKNSGDGKELCDVLVVSGNNVIIFSDKSCDFPKTGDLELDWSRWYRRTVEASQRQLSGAERWIRQYPDRVFSDRQCTQKLHVPLPPISRMRVFKIAVVIGASERNAAHFGSGSGSLVSMMPLPEDATDKALSPGNLPFTVPLCSQDGNIFHILDETTLPILLNELDTITDFVNYLEVKERLIRENTLLAIHGEEDLVGLFLGVGAGLTDLVQAIEPNEDRKLIVSDGIYSDILMRPDYRGYVEENKSSYFWDYLIANHTQAFFDGNLVEGSVKSVVENEALLRILSQESRVNRRLLADAYLDLMATAPRDEISSRTVDLGGDTIYVLQVNPRLDRVYSEYRKERQQYIDTYCFLAGWRNQDKRLIVGIVTDGTHPTKDGYDVMAIEFGAWSPEMIATGEKLSREMAKDVSRPLKERKLNPKHLTAWEPGGGDGAGKKSSISRRRPYKKRKRKRRH